MSRGFDELSLRGGNPVAQSTVDMYGGQAIDARAGAAILEIEVKMGGPERIPDDFVEPDGAAVLDKGGLWREFLAHPGDVLEPSA